MNRYEAFCPCCGATICLRCVALDLKMDPDGLDGCSDCERGLRRTRRIKQLHIERDHSDGGEARDGE